VLPPPAQRSSRNDRAAERSSGARSSAAACGRCKSKGHGRFAATLGCPRTGADARRSLAPSRGGRRRAPRTARAQRCCRFRDLSRLYVFAGRIGALVARQSALRPPTASGLRRARPPRTAGQRCGPDPARQGCGPGSARHRRGPDPTQRRRWRANERPSTRRRATGARGAPRLTQASGCDGTTRRTHAPWRAARRVGEGRRCEWRSSARERRRCRCHWHWHRAPAVAACLGSDGHSDR